MVSPSQERSVKETLVAFLPSVLPTLMVLVGILLNRNDVSRLDARITALEVSLRGEMSTLRNEMASLRSELRGEIAGIRAEMVSLRSQFHNDVLMLHGNDKGKGHQNHPAGR